MSLSCTCAEFDGDGWYYEAPDDYTKLATKRTRPCCSCGQRIQVGDLCVKFNRFMQPAPMSVSERIYGDEMPLAPRFMCEACGDQYFNLTALGFCITLGDDMMDLLREYVEMRAAA